MMETAQQFHLKWNNHSLNTLSSFQQLLDTNTLVDVSLTCSNGKTVTAHRMVLAACSEYFYRLFKDLPEKHPVIVFKDAGEEIVRDLLLFMYKGEVEVQESYLNDFLKFADTLQVKGLSQSDREEFSKQQQAQSNASSQHGPNNNEDPLATTKLESSPIKNGAAAPPRVVLPMHPTPLPQAVPAGATLPDMTKNYLAAGLGKFPPIFPLPPTVSTAGPDASSAADLLTHLSSPNLYRALHNRNKMGHLAGGIAGAPKILPDENAVLKSMNFMNLKKMFGGDNAMAAAAEAHLASLYPRDDFDNDSIAERSPPPPAHQNSGRGTPGTNDENGMASPMDASDFSMSTPPASGGALDFKLIGNKSDNDNEQRDSDNSTPGGGPMRGKGGSKGAAGRGSRLERMIAAEYKIMSEYSAENSTNPQDLPVMTPELMKSRRTHSLQLAIGEILHNRASVQSAATKYHIPRETLRRHYQRYLKAMGIEKAPATAGSRGDNSNAANNGSTSPASSTNTTVRTTVATNNNAAKVIGIGPGMMPLPQHLLETSMAQPSDESSNGFSSLMDIGQAYGIWNPDVDGSDFKSRLKDEAMRRAAAAMSAAAHVAAAAAAGAQEEREDKEKQLVIDEEETTGGPPSPELIVGEEEEEEEELDPTSHEDDGKDENKNKEEKDASAAAGATGPAATTTPTPAPVTNAPSTPAAMETTVA